MDYTRDDPFPRHEGYIAAKLEVFGKAAGLLWRRLKAAFKPKKEAAEEGIRENVQPGHERDAFQPSGGSGPTQEPLQKPEHPSLVQEAASGSHAILEKMRADSEAVSEVTKEELDRWRGHSGPGSPQFASHVVEEHGGSHEKRPAGEPSQPGMFGRWASGFHRTLDKMKGTGVPKELEDMKGTHHHQRPASVASQPLIAE